MSRRPFLLITNDDGIHASGIKHLWEAVHEFADVAIVAPLSEKSGSGLSITWTRPLLIQQVSWEKNTPAWSVNGTPADCVKMALSMLLEKTPDLIISGINRGSNAGRTVLYSGTIGGVIEGLLKGVPGIAFSFSDFDSPSLSSTKKYITALIQYVLKSPMPSGSFLNVNFPLNCEAEIKGIKVSKQGRGYWCEAPEQRTHTEGTPYYWLGGKRRSFEEDPDSDVTHLEQGFIAAAPIHISDLTDHTVYTDHKKNIETLFTDFEVTGTQHPVETVP
ncbi:MAG: 5'/3'-nucleotidase SurE [Chlamydiales bacterium]|nr:5'/3'-nucleotidase SurE [Chlamydiales bacterium]